MQFDHRHFAQGLDLTRYHRTSKASFSIHNIFWYSYMISLFCAQLNNAYLLVYYFVTTCLLPIF